MVGGFDAAAMAVQLLGDAIYTNPLLLGYAWQKGGFRWNGLRCAPSSSTRVAVARTRRPSEWGQRCGARPGGRASAGAAAAVIELRNARPWIDDWWPSRRVLTGYQDAAYASLYRGLVEKVRGPKASLGKLATEAVARYPSS